ncbi:hypothetical protein [Arenibacterium sp. LLYu02]
MTNRLALILGVLIVLTITVDVLVFGPVHMLFLAKKLFLLIEWMAFWR